MSSENSDSGHKYFRRGNVLYKKALSNARQQRVDGQRTRTRDASCGTYNKGGGPQERRKGHFRGRMQDVSTTTK